MFYGCGPTNKPELTRYLTYTDSISDYMDTVVFTFYGWPPTLDSFQFDKGVCHLVDSQEFISSGDTFSIFKYRLVENAAIDTSYYYFHHTFLYHRNLIFIQEPSQGKNQIIIDTIQYRQYKPLYDMIENDTSGYFLKNNTEITAKLRYQGVFL